jgi:hypothetical protein
MRRRLICVFVLLLLVQTAQAQRIDSLKVPYRQLQLEDGYRPLMHQYRANSVLSTWSVLSMGVGTAQMLSPNPFTRAFGMQNLIWGAIDGGIALYGGYQLRNTDWLSRNLKKERSDFRKILLVNTLLDIGYVGLGYGLLRSSNSRWHGHGTGILVQGGFLLLFDGINFALTF